MKSIITLLLLLGVITVQAQAQDPHTRKGNLGSDVEFLRIEKGLTLQELADEIPLNVRDVYRIEKSRITPDEGVLKRLCELLDASWYWDAKKLKKRLKRSECRA